MNFESIIFNFPKKPRNIFIIYIKEESLTKFITCNSKFLKKSTPTLNLNPSVGWVVNRPIEYEKPEKKTKNCKCSDQNIV